MATRARRIVLTLVVLVLVGALAAFFVTWNRPLPGGMGDAWLTAKIQAQFLTDADVRGSQIVVAIDNGVVTLSGPVTDDVERRQAVAIAQTTDGVERVVDRLWLPEQEPVATTGGRPTDQMITQAIQASYFRDRELKTRDIAVTAEDGFVTIAGKVAGDAEAYRAVSAARNVDGVRDVVNNLTIETPPAAAAGQSAPPPDPAGAAAAPPVEQPAAAAPGATDDAITASVREKLLADPILQGVEVTTADGVVRLSGTLGSEAERQRAIELARSAQGVRKVDATGLRTPMNR